MSRAHPRAGFIIVLHRREKEGGKENVPERTLVDRISLDTAEYLITTRRAVAIHQITPIGPYGN